MPEMPSHEGEAAFPEKSLDQPEPVLRIDSLTLKNYRCFSECAVSFHPQLTVLVAENAQGKTAILNGIGMALDVFVSAITSGDTAAGFELDSVHLVRGERSAMVPSTPTQFRAEGFVNGVNVQWGRELANYSPKARTSTKDTRSVQLHTEQLRLKASANSEKSDATGGFLPVVAYFKTDRVWGGKREAVKGGKKYLSHPGRFAAYADCLSPSSSFNEFSLWYGDAFNALRNPSSKIRGPEDRLEGHLAAIHESVRVVLEPTGWATIDWEFPNKESGGLSGDGFIVVEHPVRGRFPLSLLSDGVKNMVALVADLAYRCVRLNPHLGEDSPKYTPGVVLIDEVDLHLHPGWQQRVVGLLQKAFPALQIICTTHSPQVLSTVDAKSIRLIQLDDGKANLCQPKYQTRGVESADILARLMNVDPVPFVDEAHWLSDYRAMVQTQMHDSTSGCQLWEKITKHFGADHPVLAEIETLRRLQEFRKSNTALFTLAESNAKD